MTEYSTTTENASDDLTITLEADSAEAVVKLNDTEVEGSDGVYALTWGESPNEVEITVTDTGCAGEVSKTYTITVTGPVDDLSDADADSDNLVTREELEAMTVAQLKQLASLIGITLTATRKADIIDEIMGDAEAIEVPVDDGGEAEVETPGG